MNNTNTDEIRLAEQIVSVLPAGVVREFSSDRKSIRFAVRAGGLKLRTVVLNRISLKRLLQDEAREVKVEYLQRDLLRAAAQRAEFRYPRLHVHAPVARRFQFSLPLASTI